ncbi:McKusick-Kaufman/Bardet-Biedl syndromes putative chaperonin [Notolabrus celidotus]|uniref:McKusick-Kaufman/Bardet-Biedl syndromes putative chaperonin n=1 Tax=Notolabrus celidotus TaxID=1203425 RepID=UPI00148F8C00|nr:McKusick-Kaufman/Bardet-Biedl syndromes putative chaperonin [Notolabrus celidotus]XP_034537408.1 McKusick-Kaufman/Bardet-Biedl syndromes putative chaperonin [Notolabrus celidotus]
MSRLVKKSPSLCTDLPLDNSDVCTKLRLLKELLKSSFGPSGRLKQVHNNIGGHVVTTSSSSVLLAALSSSQPLVNLIKTSILNHVSRFSDCGLFAALLCLSLIEEAKQSGLRRNVSIKVNKHLLGLCITHLQQEDCGCKVRLDFCSSQTLLTLARSVISSKPACVLTEAETCHMSKLAVQAFLLTVPCSSPGTVRLGRTVTVGVEGHPVMDSSVFPGLLLEVHDVFSLKMLNMHADPLRVVLFSASLAGDLSELGDGIIEVHTGVDTDSQILDQLLELCKRAVEDGVKLFVCQKVVHPVLQQYLRSCGVMVIERVGIALMEPLTLLTGAQPVASLHASVPAKAYGTVKDLSVKEFGSKTMLHLQPAAESATICTMVVCHRNETMLSELKAVCQQTEHVLRLTLREPSALLGGGCTETQLSAHIRQKSLNEAAESSSALGCSQSELLLGVDGFCRSLESVSAALQHDGEASLIDLTHAHHWTLPADVTSENMEDSLGLCGCGLVKTGPHMKWTHLNTRSPGFSPALTNRDGSVQPRVLDCFTAKLNALQVAVETANLVLDVRYVIQDTN